MKTIIKKWLGIDVLERKQSSHFCDLFTLAKRIAILEDELQIFDGNTAKENGLKEVVYHLLRFLGIKPRREFYQEPAGVQEMVTKRRFWLEKGKKNTKLK